jgi:hypothetical protein
MALLAALVSVPARAQTSNTYNPRDDQYRLLGMTRAQSAYEQALREYNRAVELRGRSLGAPSDVEAARARMENARVDYLQAALAIVFESPHVLIDRAVKFQKADGRKYVRLTLRNESQSGAEGVKLSEIIDSTLLRQLKPEEIPNVYVSLKEPGANPATAAIVSSPYEARIPVLKFGSPVTIEFRLLKDLEVVTVSASYANQSSDRSVMLEKDASANIVSVQSFQFSQEADLGGTAVYELQLERFTSDAGGVRLAVGGLPRAIHYEFKDPASGARLTQMRFQEGVTSQRLQLSLTLPARDAGSFALDKPLQFWAFALDGEGARKFDSLAADSLTAVEAGEVPGGRVRLDLLPRGQARIEVRAANLYYEITRGDSVMMDITLRNTGSRLAQSLRLTPSGQNDWHMSVTPELIPEIPIDRSASLRVKLVPPKDIAVGDYDVRLETDALSADRQVDVEDKIVRVHVAPPANWLGTSFLVLALIGVLSAIVWFGLKLTKR